MGIKTYLNKKIYIFLFSKYIRLHFLKMINIGYMEYPPTSIGDIKDKKLKAHLKSILTLIDEITDKKKLAKLKNQSENLVTIKMVNQQTWTFLITPVEEVNKGLIKKNIFRVEFSYDACLCF